MQLLDCIVYPMLAVSVSHYDLEVPDDQRVHKVAGRALLNQHLPWFEVPNEGLAHYRVDFSVAHGVIHWRNSLQANFL